MGNERLQKAIKAAKISPAALVEATGVDPKTVSRWLNKGRTPRPSHRWMVAGLVGESVDYLWPAAAHTSATTIHTAEVVAAYAHRADVSSEVWRALFEKAQKHIDLLGHSMYFLPEHLADLVTLLKARARQGCKIRIALADPTSSEVQRRAAEGQSGRSLPGRIRDTLTLIGELRHSDSIEIGLHSTVIYNSLCRGDNEMFVMPHLYGLHGSKAPVFHLRSLGPDGLFANFAAHFERVWKEETHPRDDLWNPE